MKSGVKMKLSKEQKFDIVYYFVISFFTLFFVLNAQLGDIDELWNFIEARNISLGLFQYRDFNIVATPLSMFVNSIALLIKPT